MISESIMKYILMILTILSFNIQAGEFDYEKTGLYDELYKAQLQQMNNLVQSVKSGMDVNQEPTGETGYAVQQFKQMSGMVYKDKFYPTTVNPDYPGWLVECVLPTVENKVLPGWENVASKEGEVGLFRAHYEEFKNVSINITIENSKLQTKGNDKILRHACDANRTYGLNNNN